MNERGIKPNVISYGAAISACCAKGRWERAIELLREMSDVGVPPNTITFSAAISACEKAGRWEKALQLLDEVIGWLLVPFARRCCRCGHFLFVPSPPHETRASRHTSRHRWTNAASSTTLSLSTGQFCRLCRPLLTAVTVDLRFRPHTT